MFSQLRKSIIFIFTLITLNLNANIIKPEPTIKIGDIQFSKSDLEYFYNKGASRTSKDAWLKNTIDKLMVANYALANNCINLNVVNNSIRSISRDKLLQSHHKLLVDTPEPISDNIKEALQDDYPDLFEELIKSIKTTSLYSLLSKKIVLSHLNGGEEELIIAFYKIVFDENYKIPRENLSNIEIYYKIAENTNSVNAFEIATTYKMRVRKKIPQNYDALKKEVHSILIENEILNILSIYSANNNERLNLEEQFIRINLIHNIFMDNETKRDTKLDSKDLQDFYQKNNASFQGVKRVLLMSFFSDNIETTSTVRKLLAKHTRSMNPDIPKLKDMFEELGMNSIDLKRGSNALPRVISDVCFDRPNNWISPIFFTQKNWGFVFKVSNLEFGQFSFDEVNDEIKTRAMEKLVAHRRQHILKNIRATTPITYLNDFDFN